MSDYTGHIDERKNDGYTFRYWRSPKGKVYTNFDCERRFESAIWAVSRWFARTVRTRTTSPDAEANRDDLRTVRWKLDKLSEHVLMMQAQLDDLEGVDRTQERITQLRQIAGRTPEEAAAYLAKADELEHQQPV